MKNKGFTLIELIAVMVVLAIVFTVLIPSFINYVQDANVKGMEDLEKSLEEGSKDYHLKTGNDMPDEENKVKVIQASSLQSQGIITDFTEKCSITDTYVVAKYCGKNKIGYKAYLKCNSYETPGYKASTDVGEADGSCERWEP